ncbi:MAG TPA: PLP-dependent aminotransferase family protein [Burkholderiaceae bacterium]
MHSAILSDYLLQHFDRQSSVPGNQQLYRLLRKAILTRVLPPEARLPSSRELSSELVVCRNTVLYAYQQLLAEGFVEGRSGSGTFVIDTTPSMPVGEENARRKAAERAMPVAPAAPALSRRGQTLVEHAGASSRQWGAFVPGVPDVTQFPHALWSRLQAKAWRKPAPDALTYAQGGGHMPLREALAEYLKIARSVECQPEQVVVTAGIHQSIDLCLRLLSDPGDLAWVEDPGYWGTRNLLRASGLQIRPIAVDAEGMCPSEEDLRHVPRFIFVTPSHQYPLGSVMGLARRRKLLEFARQHGCWIVEDDYDSEFRYSAKPLLSLQGMDSGDRVLYLGTFSKTMFPGLRLGYLVLPRGLVEPFVTGVNELHRAGNVPTQAALAEFITQGFFASHIRRMRGIYAARLHLLQEIIARRYGGTEVVVCGSDAGLHLVLRLPEHCDDLAIACDAAAAGIGVRPLSAYYHVPDGAPRGLLLGYGCVADEQIGPAFETLANVLDRYLQGKTKVAKNHLGVGAC